MTNVKNDESIIVNVTFPIKGIYLFILGVGHCGANNVTKANAYWKVTWSDEYTFFRNNVSIPISGEWDTLSPIPIVKAVKSDNIAFTFTNRTGISTDETYNSVAVVYGILLNTI